MIGHRPGPAAVGPAEHPARYGTPAGDDPWAGRLLEAVGARTQDRALDVSGGILRGSALPFGDGSFDVVICGRALPLSADRERVLAEMRRVLVPRGRVGVSVLGRAARNPGLAALADVLERREGVVVAAAVRWLFALCEPGDLRALLAGAGFHRIRETSAHTTTRYGSVRQFIRRCVPGSLIAPATAHLSAGEWDAIVADLEAELTAWVDARGFTLATEVTTAVGER